jgi:hypothetical protein
MNKSYSPRANCKAVVVLLAAVSFPSVVFSHAQFTSVTDRAFGILQENTMAWGNPIWGDIDLDGDLDLIIPTKDSDPLVYKNNGNDNFNRIQNGSSDGMSGIILPTGYGTQWRGFAFGDYDGNGILDLYIAVNYVASPLKSNLLFQGTGGPPAQTYFNWVSGTALDNDQQPGKSGFWLDSDKDGKLELFVKNYFAGDIPGANRLYEYSGGVFTNIIGSGSELERAVYQSFNTDEPYGHGEICSFYDSDYDGDMDVAFSVLRKAFYKKNASGYIEDTASMIFPVNREICTGIAWGDYDNDSYPDLYVASGSLTTGAFLRTYLFHNNGNGTFTDVAQDAGVYTEANTWAPVWGDYDNDGYLDLFVTCSGDQAGTNASENANFLYRNKGPDAHGIYTFKNVAASVPAAEMHDGTSLHKTAAWADYNNDGFLDLVVKDGIGNITGITRLVKNMGNSNHWIEVYLHGLGPAQGGSNDRGIGARVQVTYTPPLAATRTAYRVNNGGGGGEYCSQGSEPLHFGIKSARTATVDVRWPSGTHDVKNLTSADIDKVITITEGCCPPQ